MKAPFPLERTAERSGCSLRQSRKHPLAQQWKFSSAIHYALDELSFVDFSLHDAVAPRLSETRQSRIFLSLDTSDQALQLRNMTGSQRLSQTSRRSPSRCQSIPMRILCSSIRHVGRRTGLANGHECFLLFLFQIERVTDTPPDRFFGRLLLGRGVWSIL